MSDDGYDASASCIVCRGEYHSSESGRVLGHVLRRHRMNGACARSAREREMISELKERWPSLRWGEAEWFTVLAVDPHIEEDIYDDMRACSMPNRQSGRGKGRPQEMKHVERSKRS